jgi:hypothetical protein
VSSRQVRDWSENRIVVSRFNESELGWLDKLTESLSSDNIFIYNKSKKKYKPTNFRNNFLLRNVGKCDHSFLIYIVNNYYNLTQFTLFITPHYENHVLNEFKLVIKSPLDFFQFCDQSMWPIFPSEIYFSPNCKKLSYLCRDYRLGSYHGSKLRSNSKNLTWGEWMIAFIEPNFDFYVKRDGGVYVNFGGTFCYSKKNILSRSFQFYTNLLTHFDTDDSEVAHYFERAWYYIFNVHINEK